MERPRCQIDYYCEGGSRSMVYGLGKRGSAMLRRIEGQAYFPFGRHSTGSTKRIFLEHALQVAEFMVRLELACREDSTVTLIRADQLPLPAEMRRSPKPLSWHVSVNGFEKVGVIPDQVFGLEWKNETNRLQRAFYFLEADLGTMPINRPSLRQSSLRRKLLAYESTWERNLHRSRLGLHRFRVIFVTTTSERVNNLVEMARQLKRGHGLFLFSSSQLLKDTPYVLTHPWETTQFGLKTFLLE